MRACKGDAAFVDVEAARLGAEPRQRLHHEAAAAADVEHRVMTRLAQEAEALDEGAPRARAGLGIPRSRGGAVIGVVVAPDLVLAGIGLDEQEAAGGAAENVVAVLRQ